MPYLNNVAVRLSQKALAPALMCVYKDKNNTFPKSSSFQTIHFQVTGMLANGNLKLRWSGTTTFLLKYS